MRHATRRGKVKAATMAARLRFGCRRARATRIARKAGLGIAALALLVSCEEPRPPEPFEVLVKLESDPGMPVQGASVSRQNRLLATTDATGRARLKLPGVEGETTDVVVTCPEGYQSPTKPLSVRLARLADKSKTPEYAVACPPSTRRVVVAIRAVNGPNLPVEYLDREVTRTDASGAASFALEVPPGSQFNVVLSTEARTDIKPVSPSKLFVVDAKDDVLLFDQRFEVERKAPPPKRRVFIPRAL